MRRNFISSLLIITTVIGVSETVVMFLLAELRNQGTQLPPLKEAFLDAVLLSLCSTPIIWFFTLRPLASKIAKEHDLAELQTRRLLELQTAVDAHALVSRTDTQGRIIYANDKFCEISGYQAHELYGCDHRIVSSGYHDKAFIRKLWETITGGVYLARRFL
ncbi:MAG: PAS domain S-box protein [Gammaproteobacteria bacterium]